MIALGDEPVLPGAIPVTDLLGLRGIPSAANRPVVNAAAIRTDAPSLCEQPVRRNGAHCRVASAPSSELSRVPLHVGEEKALPGKPTERIDVDVKRMLLRLAFVATLAAGSALSPIGVSADQPSWTLSIRQQAELLALGAVVLTVTYSCNSGVSGPSAGLTSIVQQTGIIGLAVTPATCDDAKHTVAIAVGTGFAPGTAAATVQLFNPTTLCGFATTCAVAQAEVNVQ